jgi:hypothetical protein
MSEMWKPSIRVWPFADAPEEFKRLSPFGGAEECVIYVPPELVDEEDAVRIDVPALGFLDWVYKTRGGRWQVMFAGDDWGDYALRQLPDRALVAITTGSERRYCPSVEPREATG